MNQTQSEFNEKFTTIKVIPLDMERMNKDLNIFLTEKYPQNITENEIFEYEGIYGLIEKNGKPVMIIDIECVGEVFTGVELMLSVNSEINSGGGLVQKFNTLQYNRCRMGFSWDELKAYAKPEVDLKEFMGDRFAYNSRIKNNMLEILGEFKK